jgi:hypothetical protein
MGLNFDASTVLQMFQQSKMAADQRTQQDRLQAINQSIEERKMNAEDAHWNDQAAWHAADTKERQAKSLLDDARYSADRQANTDQWQATLKETSAHNDQMYRVAMMAQSLANKQMNEATRKEHDMLWNRTMSSQVTTDRQGAFYDGANVPGGAPLNFSLDSQRQEPTVNWKTRLAVGMIGGDPATALYSPDQAAVKTPQYQAFAGSVQNDLSRINNLFSGYERAQKAGYPAQSEYASDYVLAEQYLKTYENVKDPALKTSVKNTLARIYATPAFLRYKAEQAMEQAKMQK